MKQKAEFCLIFKSAKRDLLKPLGAVLSRTLWLCRREKNRRRRKRQLTSGENINTCLETAQGNVSFSFYHHFKAQKKSHLMITLNSTCFKYCFYEYLPRISKLTRDFSLKSSTFLYNSRF